MTDHRVLLQLVALNSGQRTPYDGQFLVEYDPTRPGVDALGQRMLAHVVTTTRLDRARRFASAAEAHACRILPSGLPSPADRPLTAYTTLIVRVDGATARFRDPYVGDGVEGARRSAQIDRQEADTFDAGSPRWLLAMNSAANWDEQAARLEQQAGG